jgi:hypothetical protein
MFDNKPKNFSFIRVHPIKKWDRGNLTKSRKEWGLTGNVAHDLRFIEALNANSKLRATNQILCAKTNWKPLSATKENLKRIGIKGPEFLAEMAIGMIAKKGIVVQENHVKAAMLMAAISPEFLRDGNLDNEINPEKSRKFVEGTTSFLQKKYGDRLLMMVYHGDEQNPHISAYVLPLIEKKIKAMGRPVKGMESQPREIRLEWRLSFADFFRRDKRIVKVDPSTKETKFIGYEHGPCTVLQDEYAEELMKNGLEVQRGVRKADEERALNYETTKERYDRLRTPPTEIEGMDFEKLRKWASQIIPVVKEVVRARRERDHYQKAAGHHQQRATTLEKTLAGLQREIRVEDVIKKLTGLDPNEPGFADGPGTDGISSPNKRRKDIELEFLLSNGQRIGVTNDNAFENLTPEIPFPQPNTKRSKGRGAISTVKYLTGWDHPQATAWLADNFGDDVASQEIARLFREEISVDRDEPTRVRRNYHAVETIVDLQTPDDSQWPDACRTLTETFRFRNESFDELRKSEWIAANRHGHFVFQKLQISDTGLVPAGSFVVDPSHPAINLCETGDGLHINPGEDDKLIVCATPTDALAIKSSPENHNATVVAIGGNPTEATIATLSHLIKNHRGIKLLAENLTMAGQRLAAWIALHFSTLTKLPLPEGFAHWLDVHRLAPPEHTAADLEIARSTAASAQNATEDPTESDMK